MMECGIIMRGIICAELSQCNIRKNNIGMNIKISCSEISRFFHLSNSPSKEYPSFPHKSVRTLSKVYM